MSFEFAKRLFGGRKSTPEASTEAPTSPPAHGISLTQAQIGIFGIDLGAVQAAQAASVLSSSAARPRRTEVAYLSPAAVDKLQPLLAKVKPGIACEEIRDSHVGTALAAEHSHFRAHRDFIAKIESLLSRGERIRNTAQGFFTDSVDSAISDETFDAEPWTRKKNMYNHNSKTQNEQTQNLWADLNTEVRRFNEDIGLIWKQGKQLGETITADMTSPLAADLRVNVGQDEDIERTFENYFSTFDPWSQKTLENLHRIKGAIEPMLEPVLKGLGHLSEMRDRQQALQDDVIAQARRHHSL